MPKRVPYIRAKAKPCAGAIWRYEHGLMPVKEMILPPLPKAQPEEGESCAFVRLMTIEAWPWWIKNL